MKKSFHDGSLVIHVFPCSLLGLHDLFVLGKKLCAVLTDGVNIGAQAAVEIAKIAVSLSGTGWCCPPADRAYRCTGKQRIYGGFYYRPVHDLLSLLGGKAHDLVGLRISLLHDLVFTHQFIGLYSRLIDQLLSLASGILQDRLFIIDDPLIMLDLFGSPGTKLLKKSVQLLLIDDDIRL